MKIVQGFIKKEFGVEIGPKVIQLVTDCQTDRLIPFQRLPILFSGQFPGSMHPALSAKQWQTVNYGILHLSCNSRNRMACFMCHFLAFALSTGWFSFS
jgi:hypothetical protein